ncbi:hypothetical protein Tco_0104504 [Tanacetum coccineum]
MHIWNDPSFFFTNNIGALRGDELRRIKAFPDNSRSCTDNSVDSDGANDMAHAPQEHLLIASPSILVQLLELRIATTLLGILLSLNARNDLQSRIISITFDN